MDLKRVIETLNSAERRVVPVLSKTHDVSQIAKLSGLQDVEVGRALLWLENKGVLNVRTDPKDIVTLGENGRKYSTEGLPEKRFLVVLTGGHELSLDDIADKGKLDRSESGVAIGVLKQRGAIELLSGNKFRITNLGKKLVFEKWPEEQLISKLSKGAVDKQMLTDGEKVAFDNLIRRKEILASIVQKSRSVELTQIGKELVKMKLPSAEMLERVDLDVIKSGSWRSKQFRRYDVTAGVPSVFAGRKQHYRRFLDQVRQKFVGLGFMEMSGPIVESEFWNMDALFMPQDHSARDIHDAYYIKDPKYGRLDEAIVKKVAAEHEKGWKYKFDAKRTHRLVLRTQGTACSVRMLASKDLKIPGKYFGITRCFRHDVIDATHLPDFHQTEGIIVEEGLNLGHLFGLLKMFAKEFTGAEEIKIVPGYFPFTEPSCELYAKHPELGWIELGGAGIFRPEVVKPLLGKNVSVLAWGLGIDRIAMFKLGIADIRELFSHNLEFLRNAKVV